MPGKQAGYLDLPGDASSITASTEAFGAIVEAEDGRRCKFPMVVLQELAETFEAILLVVAKFVTEKDRMAAQLSSQGPVPDIAAPTIAPAIPPAIGRQDIAKIQTAMLAVQHGYSLVAKPVSRSKILRRFSP